MSLRIPDDVMFRELGDDVVILNLATGLYFGLSDVGAHIWRSIARHGAIDEAVIDLIATYDVAEDQARDDVTRLVEELRGRDLVRIESGQDSAAS